MSMLRFFQNKSSEYDKTLQAAQEANKFARSRIVLGSTQLENNKLSRDQQDHLKKGIEGSNISGWSGYGIRDIMAEQTKKRFEQGENPILASYESAISVSSKYTLGNCEELALQALEYILQKAPNINAEVYEIKEGDHRFLVLNRDPYSEAHDPTTWGPNAVICDPWANEVYSAKECSKRLKSYYWDEKENCHKTEPYTPTKHFLMPSEYFNTTTLRQLHSERESRRQSQQNTDTSLSKNNTTSNKGSTPKP